MLRLVGANNEGANVEVLITIVVQHPCTYFCLFHQTVTFPSKKKEGDETKEISFNQSNKIQFKLRYTNGQVSKRVWTSENRPVNENVKNDVFWSILEPRFLMSRVDHSHKRVAGSMPPQRLSSEVSLTTYYAVSRTHDINSVTCDVRNCDAYNLLVRLCRPNTDLSLSTSQNQV